ncbi:MAG: hydroxymethylbilane synthase [Burkholderiales bacterium]|jgi:hydroxymethylbilane synthase|nr:hydroxymethylbilane synthase [Burkholderiales bacterium]
MKKLRIISRNSQLALWQANFVKEQLISYYPDLIIEVIGVTTTGDKILDIALDKIGGKGLFIKELENGLLTDIADIAVHSLKDLPAKLEPSFKLGAILKREDAADAFVSNKYLNLESMPEGTIVGTSSARRVAILKRYYPQVNIKLLRGNLPTRLNKLDNREFDAIILAVAGLKRLGLDNRITQRLDTDRFLPAIGQGALAVEILSSRVDLIDYLKPLEDNNTALEVMVERMLGSKLGASCSVPIAIYAKSMGENICLDAMLWGIHNNNYCHSHIQINKSRYEDAIEQCFNELYQNGAKDIIAQYK